MVRVLPTVQGVSQRCLSVVAVLWSWTDTDNVFRCFCGDFILKKTRIYIHFAPCETISAKVRWKNANIIDSQELLKNVAWWLKPWKKAGWNFSLKIKQMVGIKPRHLKVFLRKKLNKAYNYLIFLARQLWMANRFKTSSLKQGDTHFRRLVPRGLVGKVSSPQSK